MAMNFSSERGGASAMSPDKQHEWFCKREMRRQYDDSAAYLSEKCTCKTSRIPNPVILNHIEWYLCERQKAGDVKARGLWETLCDYLDDAGRRHEADRSLLSDAGAVLAYVQYRGEAGGCPECSGNPHMSHCRLAPVLERITAVLNGA
jgi:hypothetical protein